MVATAGHPARRLLKRVSQALGLMCRLLPMQQQIHIVNTSAFRRIVNKGIDDATVYFPSGTTYQWAIGTGDISNMTDEISHAEILDAVTWALNNVAAWSGRRSVDRFSVARHNKAADIGADYKDGKYVMIASSQLFDICKFDLMHSYVNVLDTTRGD